MLGRLVLNFKRAGFSSLLIHQATLRAKIKGYLESTTNYIPETLPSQVQLMSGHRLWKWVRSGEEETHVEGE